MSEHLDGREPSDLLEDVREFARRRPGLFLLGALGAGVAFGRLARGAKDAKSSGDTRPARTPEPSSLAAPSSPPAYDPTPTPAYVPGDAGVGVEAGNLQTSAPGAGAGVTGQTTAPPHGDPLSARRPSDTPLGDEAERRLS